MWPSWKSTQRSVRIASENYGKWHRKNTEANAFRHALWSYLIASNCKRYSGTKEQNIQWAKNLTDLHEDLFPNQPLAREMDLHNNRVGLHIYEQNPSYTEGEIVGLLRGMAESSQRIEKTDDLAELDAGQLVHIENMEI